MATYPGSCSLCIETKDNLDLLIFIFCYETFLKCFPLCALMSMTMVFMFFSIMPVLRWLHWAGMPKRGKESDPMERNMKRAI